MALAETLKKHKYAVAAGIAAAFVVLYLLFRSGGGSAAASGGGGIDFNQLAQVQAAEAQSNAQLEAQQYSTQAAEQAQQAQLSASVQANQDTLAAQVAETGLAANSQNIYTQAGEQVALNGQNTNASVLTQLLNDANEEQLGNQALEGQALTNQQTLAQGALAVTTSGNGRAETGANELALVLGQGNIGSFNQATAAQGVAGTLEEGNLLSGLISGGEGVLAAL